MDAIDKSEQSVNHAILHRFHQTVHRIEFCVMRKRWYKRAAELALRLWDQTALLNQARPVTDVDWLISTQKYYPITASPPTPERVRAVLVRNC